MKAGMNERLLGMVEKIVQKGVIKNFEDHPPRCVWIFHQPKRPEKKEIDIKKELKLR